jgi:N-acetyl-alpha-D-muramate 1-phosphate uridylyltransferase
MTKSLFPVVILAGGLATRLRPLTTQIPKSLIEIHGKPFIEHQLQLLKKAGIQKVILCVNHLGNMIVDAVGDGRQFGLDVLYSFDGEAQLGTAGAIKKAQPLLDEAFFVLYGDSYLTCDYSAIQKHFIESQKKGLMTVLHNQNQWDKSNVFFKAGEIISYDKQNQTPDMQHIDYGLGLFTKEVFDLLPKKQSYDLAQLYKILLNQKQLAAFEISERFYEIGSLNGIEAFKNHLLTLEGDI